MHLIRKLTLGLSASLLLTVLSALGILFAIYQIFYTPGAVKRALQDSGAYQNVVGGALEQAQKEQGGGEDAGQIPVADPAVRSVIQEAASPAFLRSQAEAAIDDLYDWLGGKSEQLTITIELGEVKTRLADGLGNYVQQHLATLPACAAGAPISDDYDPFSASCVPAGLDPAQAASAAKEQILQGEFLQDTTTLTADSIKTKDGKSLQQQLQAVPVAYQRAPWAVYGLGLLAVLLAAGVVFLSATRRLGLKKLGIICIAAGATAAVLAWLSSFGLAFAAEKLAGIPGGIQPMQQSIIKVAQLLVGDIRVWWLGYGILLLVLGIALLITLRLTKPKTLPEPKPEMPAATPLVSPAKLPELNNKPKPRPVKKLVQ